MGSDARIVQLEGRSCLSRLRSHEGCPDMIYSRLNMVDVQDCE